MAATKPDRRRVRSIYDKRLADVERRLAEAEAEIARLRRRIEYRPGDAPEWLTINEAARALNRSTCTVRRAIREGRIEAQLSTARNQPLWLVWVDDETARRIGRRRSA